MTELTRKAGVIWNGTLKNGAGLISTESRALFQEPYTYQSRFEDGAGTNPEELIAAAHAACYSMALAAALKRNGYDPVKTDTTAECSLASKNGGYEITGMRLHVRAEVPHIEEGDFQKLVKDADRKCPVSNLLRDGLKIEIDATLEYS